MACPQWCALERSSGEIRSASDCVQLLLPLAGRWNLEKDLRALRGLEHWRGAEHGFNVDQSIRAGRSWNKKASKSQTSSSIGKTRGGLNTKIHAIVGKDLRPVAFLLSAGNVDNCTEAVPLLKLLSDLKDCDILADKAYGTKEIRTYLHDQSARYTIPPKVNTKQDDGDVFDNLRITEDSIEDQMIVDQIHDDVRKLIEFLPEEQREVLMMRHYADMSFKEIAEQTDVSINTALGRMRYALINLRKLIEKKEIILSV